MPNKIEISSVALEEISNFFTIYLLSPLGKEQDPFFFNNIKSHLLKDALWQAWLKLV